MNILARLPFVLLALAAVVVLLLVGVRTGRRGTPREGGMRFWERV